MKKIIYYVTDHGQGHATRAVALIRELLNSDYEIIIRNSTLTNFFHSSIPGIKINSEITDVGPVIKNSISVDIKNTKKKMETWITNMPKVAEKEQNFIKKINPSIIISDISAMPFIASDKVKVPSIAMSNFTWVDVLPYLDKKQISELSKAYEKATYSIRLPLHTQFQPFKNPIKVGFISRIPTMKKKLIRKKLGLSESDFFIFIPLDENFTICGEFATNTKIITLGAKIKDVPYQVISPWVEGQNLVSACNQLICKCGYGLVSEALTNNIPFQYLSDDSHFEQQAIDQYLSNLGYDNRIITNDLSNINIAQSSTNPKTFEIDNQFIANIIKEIIN